MYEFRFYVVGNSPGSKKAIIDLEAFLEDEFKGFYSLEIVDILKNPQLADEDNIFATPTLLKLTPPPSRKVLGDINNREKVLAGLDLAREG